MARKIPPQNLLGFRVMPCHQSLLEIPPTPVPILNSMAAKKIKPQQASASEETITRAYRIIRTGKNRKSITRALVNEFGSLELPARIAITITDIPDEDGAAQKFERDAEGEIIENAMDRLVRVLLNLPRWKQVAAEDRQAYQRALDRLLDAIRLIMNRHCGIESHRPQENEERDDHITRIKMAKPEWTLAQVANKYNWKKPPDEQVTRNEVGLIYDRHCKRLTERLITMWRPDFDLEPIIKAFNVELCGCEKKDG